MRSTWTTELNNAEPLFWFFIGVPNYRMEKVSVRYSSGWSSSQLKISPLNKEKAKIIKLESVRLMLLDFSIFIFKEHHHFQVIPVFSWCRWYPSLFRISGDGGRRLDFGWWTHKTIYGWRMTEWCPWNLYNSINQCCPNKYNNNYLNK